jgi:hypothetical protein
MPRFPSAAEAIAGRDVVVDGQVCRVHLGLPVEDPDSRFLQERAGSDRVEDVVRYGELVCEHHERLAHYASISRDRPDPGQDESESSHPRVREDRGPSEKAPEQPLSVPPKGIRRTRGDVAPSGGLAVGEPDPECEVRGVRSEAARLTERDSLPLYHDARKAPVDVGLEGAQLASMRPGQVPSLARGMFLEGQDPVPDGLRMGRGGPNEPEGQRDGDPGRVLAALPAGTPRDYSLTS